MLLGLGAGGKRLDALTERKREILRLLAHGNSNAELAERDEHPA